MGGVIYRLKIETRKLYWLHARYGTFKVRRKYARRTLRHERRLFKCPHIFCVFLVTVWKLFFDHYCMYVRLHYFFRVCACVFAYIFVNMCDGLHLCACVSLLIFLCICMFAYIFVHVCVRLHFCSNLCLLIF